MLSDVKYVCFAGVLLSRAILDKRNRNLEQWRFIPSFYLLVSTCFGKPTKEITFAVSQLCAGEPMFLPLERAGVEQQCGDMNGLEECGGSARILPPDSG